MTSQTRLDTGTKALLVGISISVVCVTTGCAAAPREKPIPLGPVNTGPGSVEAARKYLEGRWSLVSYEVFPADRPAIEVNGSGTLTYDAFGNLDMQVRVDDPATAEALRHAGIPLTDGMISTSGRTAIDMQARTLTYIVEAQGPPVPGAQPGPLAPTRPRHWEVEGNVLTLTTRGDDGRPLSVGRWQKQDQ